MVIKILPRWFPFLAVTVFPFILAKRDLTKEQLNHEHIHLTQQAEMMILLFFVMYILEFLVHFLLKWNRMKAYYAISFEKEAHANDKNYEYLCFRKPFESLLYLFGLANSHTEK